METRGWSTLIVLLASCGSVEATKPTSTSPSPPPTDPSKHEARGAPSAPAPVLFEGLTDEEKHTAALIEWIEQAQKDCRRTKDLEAYLPRRDGMTEEDVALVKKRCAEAIEVELRGEGWRKALSVCMHQFVKTNGKSDLACRLAPKDVPDVPPSLFELHKAQCSASCATAGPEALALDKENSQPAWCCDGTRSPTCTYKTLGPGCCAGHRGVCIE